MTTSERLILMVNQTAKRKREPEKFKEVMLERMIQEGDFTEEEKTALKQELLKMSQQQKRRMHND